MEAHISNQQRVLGIRWQFLALGLVVALVAAVRMHLSDLPLERDEGEYAYAGQLILEGIVPFSRVYNMKMPGIYAAYAGIMALLGQTPVAIRLALMVINVATCLVVFLLGRELRDTVGGISAAAFFAAMSLTLEVDGVFANAEHFALLPALCGIVLILRALDSDRLLIFVAAGVCLGVGFTMKQHGAAFIAFAGVAISSRGAANLKDEYRRVLVRLTLFFAGVILPYSLVCAVMWESGVFERFWFWTVTYAREYVSLVPPAKGLENLLRNSRDIVGVSVLIWVAAALGTVCLLTEAQTSNRARLILGLLLFSFLATCPGFHFRTHYFILLLPAVSICAGVAVSRLVSFAEGKISPRSLAAAVLVAIITAALSVVFTQRPYFLAVDPQTVSRMVFGANPFPESIPIADYLARNTSPDDTIAILGSEPQIYFYSRRKSASGFIYTYPLMEPHPFALRLQEDMIGEIEAAKPKYLLYVHVSTSWLMTERSHKMIHEWFQQYSKTCYDLVGTVEIPAQGRTIFNFEPKESDYPPRSRFWIAIFKRRSL